MTDPTPDEMRRHRAKIHNQLVRMFMDICVKLAAGSILFGLLAPFYGQPAAALGLRRSSRALLCR